MKKFILIKDLLTKYLKSSKFEDQYLAITHKKISRDHITITLNSKYETIRCIAIINYRTTPRHIIKAFDDKSKTLRFYAMVHKNIDAGVIDKCFSMERGFYGEREYAIKRILFGQMKTVNKLD